MSGLSNFFKKNKEKMKSDIRKFKQKIKTEKEKFLNVIDPHYVIHPKHYQAKETVDEKNSLKHQDPQPKVESPKEEVKIHLGSSSVEEEKIFEVKERPQEENFKVDDDLLLCPISQELMTDPVMTPYGHCFQRKYIEEWLDSHSTCPMTNNPLQKSQLVPCFTVKAIVEHHIQSSQSSHS